MPEHVVFEVAPQLTAAAMDDRHSSTLLWSTMTAPLKIDATGSPPSALSTQVSTSGNCATPEQHPIAASQ
jgi:hypothetical protein